MVLFCEVFILETEPKDSLISGANTQVSCGIYPTSSIFSHIHKYSKWAWQQYPVSWQRKISTIFWTISHYYYDYDYYSRIYQLHKRYTSELYPISLVHFL